MSASIPLLAAAAGGAGQAAKRPAATAAAVGALQAALAAEHAAVYGYGVAGAHLSGARQKAAAQDWQIHEASRDALAAMITARGAQPVAAAAAYRLPFRVNSARAGRGRWSRPRCGRPAGAAGPSPSRGWRHRPPASVPSARPPRGHPPRARLPPARHHSPRRRPGPRAPDTARLSRAA